MSARLNTTEQALLNNRLNALKIQKQKLLVLKKEERGDKLQSVNTSISTIKRWLTE